MSRVQTLSKVNTFETASQDHSVSSSTYGVQTALKLTVSFKVTKIYNALLHGIREEAAMLS